jgi:hypothetical protein
MMMKSYKKLILKIISNKININQKNKKINHEHLIFILWFIEGKQNPHGKCLGGHIDV